MERFLRKIKKSYANKPKVFTFMQVGWLHFFLETFCYENDTLLQNSSKSYKCFARQKNYDTKLATGWSNDIEFSTSLLSPFFYLHIFQGISSLCISRALFYHYINIMNTEYSRSKHVLCDPMDAWEKKMLLNFWRLTWLDGKTDNKRQLIHMLNPSIKYILQKENQAKRKWLLCWKKIVKGFEIFCLPTPTI